LRSSRHHPSRAGRGRKLWSRAKRHKGRLRVIESSSDQVARSGRRLVDNNRFGGLIAYRSSKAAVNMVMRTRRSILHHASVVADMALGTVFRIAALLWFHHRWRI
jgi:hypothetical protein